MCLHDDKLPVVHIISHDLTFRLSTLDSFLQPLKKVKPFAFLTISRIACTLTLNSWIARIQKNTKSKIYCLSFDYGVNYGLNPDLHCICVCPRVLVCLCLSVTNIWGTLRDVVHRRTVQLDWLWRHHWTAGEILPHFDVRPASVWSKMMILENIIWSELIRS